MSHTKRHGLKKKMGKKGKGRGSKRSSSKKHLVDIGTSRPRNMGQPGMNQNLAVTNALAKTMAQGLAQSQSLGMGQSLA